ncbi:hypothetical protein CPB83DRAFT_841989 [Crepidotus variabilis]|uniref:Copper acquisition factor BIM1-like domain-containing protein n=1 Tax=Crepidotus variabilis TaxID=179855 RepID=A0A9P6EV01_9AGAR|nr:hypothetical protein CPB83DRAFT_841989 [Crepidotus variabilis]
MRSTTIVLAILSYLLSTFVGVNGHFKLQYPPPRGEFDEDNEPNFCDGYPNPSNNRTIFPLSGAYFSLESEHVKWTAGVLVSTTQNVSAFDQFSQVNSFFQLQGEGNFCIPLDFSKSNMTNLQDGQNATIQIVFNGGDGALYQCADVTLSSTAKIASSIQCTNSTSSGSSNGGNTTGGGSSGPKSATVAMSVQTHLSMFTIFAALLGEYFL